MLADSEVGDLAGGISFCFAFLISLEEDEESDDNKQEAS